ncbi:FAD-dependent oxidoreductase [Caldisericum sp.]|uniref:oxidoreductase n=1 Tax=Caldisericum sp. TaxID=2499687 RepID=UPI003D0E14AF
MNYKNLFSEIKVGNLTLKNRIIFPPISTNLASNSGEVNSEFIYHYARRAKGGAALITLENMCIQYPDARNGATQPRIDDDKFIPGLSKVAYNIHSYGSLAFMELTHPGLFAETEYTEGKIPIAPSVVRLRADGLEPKELTEDEIYVIVEAFAQAALRAKKAFFDGVEIEAAHGLLVDQFLSPITNKRIDKFGGSLENRVRFAGLIIDRIKELCGKNFTVTARVGVVDFVNGGIDIKEGVKIAKAFEEMGYAAVHADVGFGNKEYRLEPMQYPEAWRTDFAYALKKEVKIPVVAVGMIRTPKAAEEILDEGKADLVALGRTLIADPDFPIKAESGREQEIKKCIGCSECIKARHDEEVAIRCGVNPSVGKSEYEELLIPSGNRKKVLVVGAGPAGLEAAITMARRGHKVYIFEKEDHIGGALKLAAVPPGKEKLLWLLDYYLYMVRKLDIQITLKKEATEESIDDFKPDTVVLAYGSKCLIPPINGIKNKNSIPFKKILNGTFEIVNKKVVVGGGGLVGCETALYLASKGNDVTILEMLPEIATGMETLSRNYLLKELSERKVKYFVNAPVREIKENLVIFGNENSIDMDYFVVAFGGVPDHKLYEKIRTKYETYIIGDAIKANKIIDAVHAGFAIGKVV